MGNDLQISELHRFKKYLLTNFRPAPKMPHFTVQNHNDKMHVRKVTTHYKGKSYSKFHFGAVRGLGKKFQTI